MKTVLKTLAVAGAVACAAQASAQVTFFEDDNFQGRSFTGNDRVGNFDRQNFNDAASSAIVRNGTWEVCEDARFSGRCIMLRPGNYPSFRAMGFNDRVSSVRPADTYGGNPPPTYAAPAPGGY